MKLTDIYENLLNEFKISGKIYHGGAIKGVWNVDEFMNNNNLDKSNQEAINSFFQTYITSRVQDGFYWFTDDISMAREFANYKSDSQGGGLLFLVEADSYAKNTLKTTWDEMEEMIYELRYEKDIYLNHFAELAPYLKSNTDYDSWFTDMKIMGQPYNDICLFDKNLFKVTNVIFGYENVSKNIPPSEKSLYK